MKAKKTLLLTLLSVMALAGCGEKKSEETVKPSTEPKASDTAQPQVVKWNGNLNLAGLPFDEKTALLGEMEKYAMKNHLVGIPLYGDGGYTLLSERFQLPVKESISNYGFGLVREGKVKTAMTAEQEPNEAYRSFYHVNAASVENNLSSLDASDNSTTKMVGYITSGLFNNRLVKNKDAGKTYKEGDYEWYGSYVKQDAPTPVDEDFATSGTSKKWRFKVKTGANSGLKFKTLSTKSIGSKAISSFNDKDVTVDDYIFALKCLLTYSYKNYYNFQYASDTSTIVGAEDKAIARKGKCC